MQEQQTVHIDLVLRFESNTVTGVIRRPDGDERTFVGWLGLLADLQREGPPDRAGPPRGSVG